MPEVNWNSFADLHGDVRTNFERLWRSLIQNHYGQYGSFRMLANQPGVEFHLQLDRSCILGEPQRWYGWQCKWYDLERVRAIGSTRRKYIEDALGKTTKHLPELTDWVLCTRHPLTSSDQAWFYGLQTSMELHLWTGADLERHLAGPGSIYRGTYFGELVLTPDLLQDLHKRSVAQIRSRWQPETHQQLDPERALRRNLGEVASWSDVHVLTERLESGANALASSLSDVPPTIRDTVEELIQSARNAADPLKQIKESLDSGDYEVLRQELETLDAPRKGWNTLLCRLRGAGHRASLDATNLSADIYGACAAFRNLHLALGQRLVAVIAGAGYGKTQLAAQLTASTEDRPAGILLYGKDLPARHALDCLAKRVVIYGKQVTTFEALVAAVNAAGERAGLRLPIVIDGLNEAEDPRIWKEALASLNISLKKYPYVLVVCTLRPAVEKEVLPSGMETLEMSGFENYTLEAINRYFQYYCIDPTRVHLPYRLLRHPLRLRMFCEVTNPRREHAVRIESIPNSLTALFVCHLNQVAERIQQLAPQNARHQAFEISDAINRIGLALWDNNTRVLDMQEVRDIIGDSDRPWSDSVVRALEDNGVLIRGKDDQSGPRDIAVVSDSLAGHVVADALLKKYRGDCFESWFQDVASAKLVGKANSRHPLADDVFRSLVGLSPISRHRKHLWPLLNGSLRERALELTVGLEAKYLDNDTVSEVIRLINSVSNGRHGIFDRIWDTRVIPSHPINASFLDSVLRPMSIPDRDRRWTEWLRSRVGGIISDLQWLEECWRTEKPERGDDRLHVQWVMWTLTSTVRRLRDHATKALYRYGCLDPKGLFAMTLDSLEVNDPYVSERMLAACYGVAMSLWADPKGDHLREALPSMAKEIIERMFVPGAPYGTRHVLTRDYAAGLVTLATQIKPGCISQDKLRYTSRLKHIPSPFPDADTINDSDVAEAKEAIRMDFGNYTIGRLIPVRYNYDYNNPTHQDVCRQIYWRIRDLGYSPAQFRDIDKDVVNNPGFYGGPSVGKVDRYGKKYSWIAFFEMFGVHLDEGILPARHGSTRPSDADIDPSFPTLPKTWRPPLSDPFDGAPTDPKMWSKDGPMPDYAHLLRPGSVDDCEGPWVLLDGYIQQASATDERLVWTSLRCCFVDPDQCSELLSKFESVKYVGQVVPEPETDYYTYAGEIPWSKRFGSDLRDANDRARPNCQEAFTEFKDETWQPGISVEIPRYKFAWEGYHSQLNQVSDVSLPAPSLCEELELRNHQYEWDLFDKDGNLATMHRVFGSDQDDQDTVVSKLTYLCSDLLKNYLEESGRIPVWLSWGERSFRSRSLLSLMDEIGVMPSRYRRAFTWEDVHRKA